MSAPNAAKNTKSPRAGQSAGIVQAGIVRDNKARFHRGMGILRSMGILPMSPTGILPVLYTATTTTGETPVGRRAKMALRLMGKMPMLLCPAASTAALGCAMRQLGPLPGTITTQCRDSGKTDRTATEETTRTCFPMRKHGTAGKAPRGDAVEALPPAT